MADCVNSSPPLIPRNFRDSVEFGQIRGNSGNFRKTQGNSSEKSSCPSNFCPQFWGRKWLRQFYGHVEKLRSFCRKTHVHKFLVLGGGGILGFFWGGGKCRFYFYGREDFSEFSGIQCGVVSGDLGGQKAFAQIANKTCTTLHQPARACRTLAIPFERSRRSPSEGHSPLRGSPRKFVSQRGS